MLRSKATPLDRVNVDTDQIVPKQFLKLVNRSGFGKYLFYDWRFDMGGKPRADFVLNNPKYSNRQILLTRDNFGSGSSREHAVWAIADYGFKAIISPSFADIFYNNCLTNGVLPVRLPSYEVDYLFSDDDLSIEIDLAKQSVTAGLHTMHFEIDNFHKKLLLEGLDSIGLTLKLEDYISRYEKQKQLFALRGN
ncbi:MAG: 3-isopropylmalate dehydratase small subunit [Thermoproteota archaeon]|jgi:3-isopropylmalate/(R)-2-methylmalate dehydratase small subunit|nr:3-isopropylmalate dehydratase small subunit [Thermoproteota archaeon]